jgi:hypothetical protein
MYKLQLCLVPTGTNQQPLPPPIPLNPTIIQQLLGSQATGNSMPWREDSTPMYFHGILPFSADPVYQGMAQEQHPSPSHYRAPSLGPSRHQRRNKGFRKAETPYTNHYTHESSRTVARDHSTSNHPGHARIGAVDNTGVGKVWSIPSRNPSMVDHNSNPADADDEASIRQGSSEPLGVRGPHDFVGSRKYVSFCYPSCIDHFINNSAGGPMAGGPTVLAAAPRPYNRGHSKRTRKRRDLSEYEVPISVPKSMLISLSILYRPFHQQLFAGGAMPGGPTMPAPAPALWLSAWTTTAPAPLTSESPSAETNTTKVQERT